MPVAIRECSINGVRAAVAVPVTGRQILEWARLRLGGGDRLDSGTHRVWEWCTDDMDHPDPDRLHPLPWQEIGPDWRMELPEPRDFYVQPRLSELDGGIREELMALMRLRLQHHVSDDDIRRILADG